MTGFPGSAPPMLWTPADALGQTEIDHGHARTAALHRAAIEAEDSRLPAAFRILCEHLAGQFAREERLMALRGFPPVRLHAAEHAALLAACGKPMGAAALREFLRLRFQPWFRHHLGTMDRATARFLNGERFTSCALLCGRPAPPPGGGCDCAIAPPGQARRGVAAAGSRGDA
jgi:hemerythrin